MFGPDPPPHLATEGTIDLADGRQLGYAEYGPPDGDPLVLFHGLPGSRYSVFGGPSLLAEYNLRQIVLERPGFGRSTYDPDREFIDWPTDVQEATATLNLEKFALLGVSGGAPYVLVCAARLSDRLTNVGIVSGHGPLDAPGATDGLSLVRRFGYATAPLPVVLWPVMWFVIQAIRLDTGHDAIRGGVRKEPKGPLHETRLQVRPWGFDLSSIPCHVHLWHGEQDTSAPISMAEHVVAQLPSSTLHSYPDAGHVLPDESHEDILATLCNQ
jgi:pimeloyl-ACP methyl ester carboxylesterase